MTDFTRKNEITVSGVFLAASGSGAQPTNAEAVLSYISVAGQPQVDRVTLTNSAGTWAGAWDSSNAAPGEVEWTIHCWGGLQAAQDGKFKIKANRSNLAIS